METRQCHFLRTRILRTACEIGLSLIFFGPEPAHIPFGTEHKHTVCMKSKSNSQLHQLIPDGTEAVHNIFEVNS